MQTLAVCIIVLGLTLIGLGQHVARLTHALRRLQKRHRRLLKHTAAAFDDVAREAQILGKDLDALETTVEQHRAGASSLFQHQAKVNEQLALMANGDGKVVRGPWK